MQKRYRPNVAAVILASSYPFDCKILIAQRCDLTGIWQFPQGGIDEGETPREALKRELKEEIGTDGDTERLVDAVVGDEDADILVARLSYDFPEGVASRKFYDFDGQTQKYFLVRLRPGAKININTKKPEFSEYKFINSREVLNGINHFKKPIYGKVIGYFKEKGFI